MKGCALLTMKKKRKMTPQETADYRQDWGEFKQFAAKALKYTSDIHHVLTQLDIEGKGELANKLRPGQRLSDYSDIHFFNLGAIYTRCYVPFDIVAEFERLTGYDGPRVAVKFDHEIIAGIGEWSYILEGIARTQESIDLLRKFLTTQMIIRDPGELWVVRHHNVLVADPLAVDRSEYNETEDKPMIDLFLPSGNGFELQPDVTSTLPVALRVANPDPRVVKQAEIVNTITLPGRLKTSK
jgi:hypothetical protein